MLDGASWPHDPLEEWRGLPDRLYQEPRCRLPSSPTWRDGSPLSQRERSMGAGIVFAPGRSMLRLGSASPLHGHKTCNLALRTAVAPRANEALSKIDSGDPALECIFEKPLARWVILRAVARVGPVEPYRWNQANIGVLRGVFRL
jgi:hypothetical protein